MKFATLQGKILPSLLTGTSRSPLPCELIPSSHSTSDGALEMLSLTGQALCFERPSTPDSFIVEPQIKDERRIVADNLRRPLIRLLTGKNATEHPARALARAFDFLRLRPHPFDLPSMDAFVRTYSEKLGATAQHWADRQKPAAETQSYFDPELVDERNWAQATLLRRVGFIKERRGEDADAARALLESTWAQEDADSSFQLLQVLQVGLSAADQPFLATLEKDRAPRVRAIAAKLLVRLGAGGENPALRECLERIKQSKSGLLRKHKVQLDLPANVKDQAASRWILQTFTEVSFSELASALQLTEEQLIDAAAKNEHLLLALALIATNDHRLNLLELVLAHLPNAWELMFESGLNTLGTMAESERQLWMEIIVRSRGDDLPTTYFLWDWLHRVTESAATASVMSLVFRTKLLTKVPEHERGRAHWLELIAAICPAGNRPKLRELVSEYDSSQTVSSLLLLDILDGMENDRTHV